MGSVCDTCFGSSDTKPTQKIFKGASFRQSSVSTQQLTEHEHSGYGSQYDACAHKREEHLPPSWNRGRFGSDESNDSRGGSSGKPPERSNAPPRIGSPGDSTAHAPRTMPKFFNRKAFVRQQSIDTEVPVRKLSRNKSRVR